MTFQSKFYLFSIKSKIDKLPVPSKFNNDFNTKSKVEKLPVPSRFGSDFKTKPKVEKLPAPSKFSMELRSKQMQQLNLSNDKLTRNTITE